MTRTVRVPVDHLESLLDAITAHRNTDSVSLSVGEVDAVRAVAVLLGVDPATATPREHMDSYPHRLGELRTLWGLMPYPMSGGGRTPICGLCGRVPEAVCHVYPVHGFDPGDYGLCRVCWRTPGGCRSLNAEVRPMTPSPFVQVSLLTTAGVEVGPVGVLPFTPMPEVIAFGGAVFLRPADLTDTDMTPVYRQGTLYTHGAKPSDPPVRPGPDVFALVTPDIKHVVYGRTLDGSEPDVINWGTRVFVRRPGDTGNVYVEGMLYIAPGTNPGNVVPLQDGAPDVRAAP